MSDIIDLAKAGKLPRVYQAAINALERCSSMDECEAWKDKAAALASYAKQAGDETLHRYADRIKARAVRRCGQLAKLIEPKRGANQNIREGDHRKGRKANGHAAGLSDHQLKQAIRVANVPAEDFERQVESEKPPTVTALAQQGKKPAPSLRGEATIQQFRAASKALGKLRDFAHFVSVTDAQQTAAGVQPSEIRIIKKQVASIDQWLDAFVVSIKE